MMLMLRYLCTRVIISTKYMVSSLDNHLIINMYLFLILNFIITSITYIIKLST